MNNSLIISFLALFSVILLTFANSDNVSRPNTGEPLKLQQIPPKKININPGTGPLLPEVFEKNPRLVFLGSVSGKNFYIERTQMTWLASQSYCHSLGMQLASFSSATEQTAVYEIVPTSDNLVWTGARLRHPTASAFSWQDTNGIVYNVGTWAFGADLLALAFAVDRSADSANSLIVSSPTRVLYPLCFL